MADLSGKVATGVPLPADSGISHQPPGMGPPAATRIAELEAEG
jgi:hypothetical protein